MRKALHPMIHSVIMIVLLAGSSRSAAPAPDFQPDPSSVVRYGPAYRYPHAGWIVLHIEGEPYERGYQHGRLLAPEIAAQIQCLAAMEGPSAPAESWRHVRRLVDALFLRRYDREYLEEMKGIADGASDAGARFDGRLLDLLDITAVNSWTEVDFLDSALRALPNGLEGKRFKHQQPRTMPGTSEGHCSAFAAVGPATADGKIVIGHITMFGLYASNFFNVWLDIKPARGYRMVIQGFPGAIQSGLDYYMNEAGIVITETTIGQTPFNIKGASEVSRIRKAIQYANSIDRAVEILKTANNGLYSNEWLLADAKTNEIAMFELGTHKSKLYRSSKNEWFGNTPGFYWGCNNAKDLAVRLETVADLGDRPANVVFSPSPRDRLWLALYEQHKGKIGVEFGKLAFTTPVLAAYHSVDAKVTTSDLLHDLKSWALFGPPLGRTWQPTEDEKRRFPAIRPLVSNPWAVLHVHPPAKVPAASAVVVVDVPEQLDSSISRAMKLEEIRELPTVPAWHGTLLPGTDADIWLTAAFAEYERIVANENARRERNRFRRIEDTALTTGDRDALAIRAQTFRSEYLTAARREADLPLAGTMADLRTNYWHRRAVGKGVLVLQELRRLVGPGVFSELMDSFGRAHAGKTVSSSQFQTHAEKFTGKSLKAFFEYWLGQIGLPEFKLHVENVMADGTSYQVKGEVVRDAHSPGTAVRLALETIRGEEFHELTLTTPRTPFVLRTTHKPVRLTLDKYAEAAKLNGGAFTIHSFREELDKTLIVYGTRDEASTNQEAAEELQRALVTSGPNLTVPIRSDETITDQEIRTHHLLLIGRPDSNSLVQRYQEAFPVKFGMRSIAVRQDTYAHANSAALVAGENPANKRFSVVAISGMSAEATYRAAPVLGSMRLPAAEVVVLPNRGQPRPLTIPAAELVKELEGLVSARVTKATGN